MDFVDFVIYFSGYWINAVVQEPQNENWHIKNPWDFILKHVGVFSVSDCFPPKCNYTTMFAIDWPCKNTEFNIQ